MEKALATELMKEFLGLGAHMNEVVSQIDQVDVEEQKRILRRGIANLMGLLYTDLMLPKIQEYPELDPDK